jgi:hypothetical protein
MNFVDHDDAFIEQVKNAKPTGESKIISDLKSKGLFKPQISATAKV